MAAILAKKIARAAISYQDRCIISTRSHILPIGRPRHAPGEACVPAIGDYIISAKSMPDVHNAVSTTRCKLFPIGRPGYRKEAIRMTPIGTMVCSANSIPDVNSFIARARRDIATIGRPCYGKHLIAMAMIVNFTRHTQTILGMSLITRSSVFFRPLCEQVYGMGQNGGDAFRAFLDGF